MQFALKRRQHEEHKRGLRPITFRQSGVVPLLDSKLLQLVRRVPVVSPLRLNCAPNPDRIVRFPSPKLLIINIRN